MGGGGEFVQSFYTVFFSFIASLFSKQLKPEI